MVHLYNAIAVYKWQCYPKQHVQTHTCTPPGSAVISPSQSIHLMYVFPLHVIASINWGNYSCHQMTINCLQLAGSRDSNLIWQWGYILSKAAYVLARPVVSWEIKKPTRCWCLSFLIPPSNHFLFVLSPLHWSGGTTKQTSERSWSELRWCEIQN